MEKSIIVIPTYNERENIREIIRGITEVSPDISILVVDDNSPDGTADEVRGLQKVFPSLSLLVRDRKEGLGKAYVDAFHRILKSGSAKKIVTMDADLSHDPKHLPALFAAGEKYNVVVGSRYVRGGGIVGWELWRRVLSMCGNFYARSVTRIPVKDCTSGFNLIDAAFLKKIPLDSIDSSGYAFLIELKYLLFQERASFFEVPIVFHNRTGGESKISNHIIREGMLAPWKMIFRNFL